MGLSSGRGVKVAARFAFLVVAWSSDGEMEFWPPALNGIIESRLAARTNGNSFSFMGL